MSTCPSLLPPIFSLCGFAHLALSPVYQLERVPCLSSDSCARLALGSFTCQGLTAREAELSRLGSPGPGWRSRQAALPSGERSLGLRRGEGGQPAGLGSWTLLVGVGSRLRGPDAGLGGGELVWTGTGGRGSRVPPTLLGRQVPQRGLRDPDVGRAPDQ